MSALIKPGEKGFDTSTHYPSAKSALDQGYTFAVGYDSPNVKKNIPLTKCHEYIDAGLGVWIVYEINAGRSNLGYSAGLTDGAALRNTLLYVNYDKDVAGIMANDTDTTNVNLNAQAQYMRGAREQLTQAFPQGSYLDTDLAQVTTWDLGWLPNAWGWDHPNPRKKSVAIAQAKQLGYHMIQGRMSDDVNEPSYDTIDGINVDINWCIKECFAWGNPRTKEEPMTTPYIFRLDNGGLGIRHEAGSRSINEGELAGPFKGEPVYDVPKGSNWEGWILQELAKYERDLNPATSSPITFPPIVFPPFDIVARATPA